MDAPVGEVLEVIQDLAASGMTMLLVSHEMLFVRDVASHVVFMDDDRIAEQGTPREIFQEPPVPSGSRAFSVASRGIFRGTR